MTNPYSQELIDEIKESNDIVEIISQYISLKRTGSNYKGLCPFHNEKTPSFVVSPSKQFYHCFGCGEGGNVINFIMRHEGMDFPEALRLLADRAGIILENQDREYLEAEKRKKLLYQINKEAAKFYYNNLKISNRALKYVNSRNLDTNIIKAFGIGYSLQNWSSLLDYLLNRGYEKADIESCGLIIKRKDGSGYYDRFRDRIIFPIINTRGNIIGFGGRVIDDSQPKYLNSPDTEVFLKGNNLYGLNVVRKHFNGKKIILVEGYMDVISLFKRGINYSVASLGTALTTNQAKLLSRYYDDIYICYDSDKAGLLATEKAIDIIKSIGVSPKIILLKDSKDPDEYINKFGKESFELLLESALNYIEFKIHYYKKRYNLSQLEGNIEFTKEISKILREVSSPVEVEAYIKKISIETGISIEAIKNEISGYKRIDGKLLGNKDKYINTNNRNNNKDRILPVTITLEPGHLNAEKNLLYLIINDESVYKMIKDDFDPNDFTNEEYKEIAAKIYESYHHEDSIDIKPIIEKYNLTEIYNNKNSTLLSLSLDSRDKLKAAQDYIKTINYYRLKIEKNRIKNEIKLFDSIQEKSEGDVEKFKLLCLKLTEIEKELKLHQ